MKKWIKEYKETLLAVVFALVICLAGALADHYIFHWEGGMTLSEMEALAQEYRDANVTDD